MEEGVGYKKKEEKEEKEESSGVFSVQPTTNVWRMMMFRRRIILGIRGGIMKPGRSDKKGIYDGFASSDAGDYSKLGAAIGNNTHLTKLNLGPNHT